MDNIDEFPYGMQTWRLRGNTGTKWRFNSLEKIMEVNGGFSSKPCLKIRDGKSAVNPIESPLHILKAHKYIESSLNPIQSPLNPINSPLNHMFVFVFSPCVSLFFCFSITCPEESEESGLWRRSAGSKGFSSRGHGCRAWV